MNNKKNNWKKIISITFFVVFLFSAQRSVVNATDITNAGDVETIRKMLQLLNLKMKELILKADEKGIPLPIGVDKYMQTHTYFEKDLGENSRGNDVIALQVFLINQQKGNEAKKLSTMGASGYFGPQTKKALIEFQTAEKIYPASGFFGPITREKINIILY